MHRSFLIVTLSITSLFAIVLAQSPGSSEWLTTPLSDPVPAYMRPPNRTAPVGPPTQEEPRCGFGCATNALQTTTCGGLNNLLCTCTNQLYRHRLNDCLRINCTGEQASITTATHKATCLQLDTNNTQWSYPPLDDGTPLQRLNGAMGIKDLAREIFIVLGLVLFSGVMLV